MPPDRANAGPPCSSASSFDDRVPGAGAGWAALADSVSAAPSEVAAPDAGKADDAVSTRKSEGRSATFFILRDTRIWRSHARRWTVAPSDRHDKRRRTGPRPSGRG